MAERFDRRDGDLVAKGIADAFEWMQKAMEGEAERAGLTSEEAIMDLVREIRYGEKSTN